MQLALGHVDPLIRALLQHTPFQELKIGDKYGLYPFTFVHLRCGQSLPPSPTVRFWQVKEWASASDERLQERIQFAPRRGDQTRSYSCSLDQLISAIETDY
jgi:hypothetical protein